MSSTQLNAGEAHGNVQEKIQQYTEAAKDNASSAAEIAHDKASNAADQSGGFLQQTSEQMMSMAQGAIDGVKKTLGVGDNKK